MIQPTPLTLSHEERALIAAYRQCDARGKRSTFACVLGEVEDRPKSRPHLSLVTTNPTIAEAPNVKR